MVRAHYYSWFDRKKTPHLQPWDLEAERGPVPNAAYFARVFTALEDIVTTRNPAWGAALEKLTVIVTPNAHVLPQGGSDVVALLVQDNWARMPRWTDDVALVLATNRDRRFADGFGMLPRPLGLAEIADEARVRIERGLWARRGHRPRRYKAPVIPMPLGYAYQHEVPEVAWEDRDIDVYFAGSTVHGLDRGGRVRRALRSSVGNVKVLHRQKMLAAAEQLRRVRPDLNVRVDLVDGDAVSAHADSYSELMARTRFCLDPRGTSRETFRYYEAVRVGAVPVVTSLPRKGLYTGAPALRLRHWSDLPSAMERMRRHPEQALALHEATKKWWADHGSPEATARRIAPHVECVLHKLGGGA